MDKSLMGPRPQDYVEATYQVFAACPRISGLRLVSVEAAEGILTALFEGPLDDFRGPYGIIVRLPRKRQDQLWARYASGEGTVGTRAHTGVALRAVEAHTASQNEDRGYTSGNVWWLINDTTTTASRPTPPAAIIFPTSFSLTT